MSLPNNNKSNHKVVIVTNDDRDYEERSNNKSPTNKEKSDKKKRALALSKSPGSFSLNRRVKVKNKNSDNNNNNNNINKASTENDNSNNTTKNKNISSADSSSSSENSSIDTEHGKKSIFQTLFFVINIVVMALIFGVLAIISATIFTQGLKSIDEGMEAAAGELAETVALKVRTEFSFQRIAGELLYNTSQSLSPETGNPYSSEMARERFVKFLQVAPLSFTANKLWPKVFFRFIDGSSLIILPYDPAINESDTSNKDQDMLDQNFPPTLSPSQFPRAKFHRFQLCRSYTGVYNSTVASNPNLQLDLQHDCNISVFNVTDINNITAKHMTDETSVENGVSVLRSRSESFFNSQGYNLLRRLVETAPSNATWYGNAISEVMLSFAGSREPMIGSTRLYSAKYPFDAASASLQQDAFVSWMLAGVSVKELCVLLNQMKPVDIPTSQIFLYSPKKERVFAFSNGITYQISALPITGMYPNCIATTDSKSMACFYNLTDYVPYQPLREVLESTTRDYSGSNTHRGHEHDTSSSSVSALHSSIPIDIFFEDLILHFFLPKSYFQEAVNESLAVAAAVIVTITCAAFVVGIFFVKVMIVRIEYISNELSKNPFLDWSEIEEGILQQNENSSSFMLRLSCDTEEVSELEEAFAEFRTAILKLRSFLPSSTLQPTAIDMIAGGGDDEDSHQYQEDGDADPDHRHHDKNNNSSTDDDREEDEGKNNNSSIGNSNKNRGLRQTPVSSGSSAFDKISTRPPSTVTGVAADDEREFALNLRQSNHSSSNTPSGPISPVSPHRHHYQASSQASQQPLTENAGACSPDSTGSSDRLHGNYLQKKHNDKINNIKTTLLQTSNTSTVIPKSADESSMAKEGGNNYASRDANNNNNDDDANAHNDDDNNNHNNLSSLQTRHRSNTETSDKSEGKSSDQSSIATTGLVSILKKKNGVESGNSVKIRRRRGSSKSNPKLTTPLGNTTSHRMSQSDDANHYSTQDAEEEELIDNKSEKNDNNSKNDEEDPNEGSITSVSTAMRVQFNPVVLNVAHPSEQKISINNNTSNNSTNGAVVGSNSVSASMSDDRFSFTSSHNYQQPSTLINNKNNNNVSNYISSPHLIPSALRRGSGSHESSDFGSNNNNNNSAVTPTLLKDGSAENDRFLSAQDKKSIKLSRNHRCLVASVHFFGPGDQDEINHRRERFHQSKRMNHKLNRGGVDMTRSADSMDGGNNYSEGGPDIQRIRSFRSTGSSSSSSQHSSFATTEEKQKLVDRSAIITELMMKEVIESTGAHLIEYRNDTYGLALLLSRRQRSLLAYRFMSKLVSVSQKIAEHPLQRPYNQGSNGTVCMVVGFSVGLSKILSLFVESSSSPASSMPPPSSAPAAADNSHHQHSSSFYDHNNNNDDSDTSTHPSRPVTIVTDCISFANKIERSLRFKMIDDKLKASVLAKRKRISELHDQHRQQKLNNDNSDDDDIDIDDEKKSPHGRLDYPRDENNNNNNTADFEEDINIPPGAAMSNSSSNNNNDNIISKSTNNSLDEVLPHQVNDDNLLPDDLHPRSSINKGTDPSQNNNSSDLSTSSPQDRVIKPSSALPPSPSPSPITASDSSTTNENSNSEDNKQQLAVVSVGDRHRVSSLVDNNVVQKSNRTSNNNNNNNNITTNKTDDEKKIAASLTHCIGYMFLEVGQLIPYMVSQEYPFMKFSHTWNCYTKKTVAKKANNHNAQEQLQQQQQGSASSSLSAAAASATVINNNTNNQQQPETEMVLSFLKGAISVNRVLGFAEAAVPAGASSNNTEAATANQLSNDNSTTA